MCSSARTRSSAQCACVNKCVTGRESTRIAKFGRKVVVRRRGRRRRLVGSSSSRLVILLYCLVVLFAKCLCKILDSLLLFTFSFFNLVYQARLRYSRYSVRRPNKTGIHCVIELVLRI